MKYFPFLEAFERIKTSTEIKKLTQLADFIGVSQPAVSQAKKKGTFPTDWAVAIEEEYGVLTRWILTGEGPARHNQSETMETPQAAPQPPPAADPNLPAFLLDLNTWAKEISEPPGNLKWLEKQLETCLPTWKTWREAKEEEAKKTALPNDKVA